jgi:hypothetical protein
MSQPGFPTTITAAPASAKGADDTSALSKEYSVQLRESLALEEED